MDFYTSSCAPCKHMAPILDEAASKLSDVAFFKVNAQTNPELAARFGIRSVPTFLVMVAGTVKGQKSGTMTVTQMQDWIVDCLRS